MLKGALCINLLLCLLLSKGNRVNIPEHGRGDWCFGTICGNANEPGDTGRSPGKSSLFFVRDELHGIASRGDMDVVPVKHRVFAVSGALFLVLENPGESDNFRAVSYPYPQQVSKVNSL